MPRSVASVKKRNKAAKARKSFWKRRKVIDLIETTADNVPENTHVEYFNNLPIEELSELHVERSIVLPSNLHANRLVEIAYFVEQSHRLGIHDAKCTIDESQDYGNFASELSAPDLDIEALEIAKNIIMIELDNDNIRDTEEDTRGQSANLRWGLLNVGLNGVLAKKESKKELTDLLCLLGKYFIIIVLRVQLRRLNKYDIIFFDYFCRRETQTLIKPPVAYFGTCECSDCRIPPTKIQWRFIKWYFWKLNPEYPVYDDFRGRLQYML
ncbi:hypothetical protein FQA39_LY00370 [Lamprigera yunnana]|nr:hypothetical protein FQA39_LY00370 [Lamprigera yunnana]